MSGLCPSVRRCEWMLRTEQPDAVMQECKVHQHSRVLSVRVPPRLRRLWQTQLLRGGGDRAHVGPGAVSTDARSESDRRRRAQTRTTIPDEDVHRLPSVSVRLQRLLIEFPDLVRASKAGLRSQNLCRPTSNPEKSSQVVCNRRMVCTCNCVNQNKKKNLLAILWQK